MVLLPNHIFSVRKFRVFLFFQWWISYFPIFLKNHAADSLKGDIVAINDREKKPVKLSKIHKAQTKKINFYSAYSHALSVDYLKYLQYFFWYNCSSIKCY